MTNEHTATNGFNHTKNEINANSQSFVNGHRVLFAWATAPDTYIVLCHRPDYTDNAFAVWFYSATNNEARMGYYTNNLAAAVDEGQTRLQDEFIAKHG